MINRAWLGGYPIVFDSEAEVVRVLRNVLREKQKSKVFFANTNFVVKCKGLRPSLDGDDVFILNDGVGLDLAARFFVGRSFPSNLNGTDFLPAFLRDVSGSRVFLVGGKPGVAIAAAKVMEREFGVSIAGCCNGYEELRGRERSLVEEINASGAQIVLVAMGNPIQENWILENAQALDASLLFGVGALFDFLSGASKRAPSIVRQLRLEWLYRLLKEPKRLMRRYTLDLFVFFGVCFRARKIRGGDFSRGF